MPVFDTPEPISATIELAAARVRIVAGDRADTAVDVRPTDPFDDGDVKAAGQVQVGCSGGRLLVRGRTYRAFSLFRGGSVDLTVELPAGSRIDAKALADFRCEGRLGDCRFHALSGDVWLEETGRLQVESGSGAVSVGRTAGHTEVTTADGEIRIGGIGGTAVLKTANGGIAVGEAAGAVRMHTAYGDISVDRALAGVTAKTATGEVRIGEAVRGSITLVTGYGGVEVGVRRGTAAWLDVASQYGEVRVALDDADDPGTAVETVEVRATTDYGAILVRHA